MKKPIDISGLVTVVFANEDEDVTLGTASMMQSYGQQLANELGCAITARDPISDKVLATFEPALAEAAE
jgi:hypothetical protein